MAWRLSNWQTYWPHINNKPLRTYATIAIIRTAGQFDAISCLFFHMFSQPFVCPYVYVIKVWGVENETDKWAWWAVYYQLCHAVHVGYTLPFYNGWDDQLANSSSLLKPPTKKTSCLPVVLSIPYSNICITGWVENKTVQYADVSCRQASSWWSNVHVRNCFGLFCVADMDI